MDELGDVQVNAHVGNYQVYREIEEVDIQEYDEHQSARNGMTIAGYPFALVIYFYVGECYVDDIEQTESGEYKVANGGDEEIFGELLFKYGELVDACRHLIFQHEPSQGQQECDENAQKKDLLPPGEGAFECELVDVEKADEENHVENDKQIVHASFFVFGGIRQGEKRMSVFVLNLLAAFGADRMDVQVAYVFF